MEIKSHAQQGYLFVHEPELAKAVAQHMKKTGKSLKSLPEKLPGHEKAAYKKALGKK